MNFRKLTAYLDSLQAMGIPGCDVAIWQNHQPLYRHQSGFRDDYGTEPMNGNEVYWLYSASKVLTATSAMQLKAAGLIHLDDPVSKYLPAYAHLKVRHGDGCRPAQVPMTLRHLLSMQSGLDYNLECPSILNCLERTSGQATTREIADALATHPLQFEPGTHFLYGHGHDVMGAVIEVVSGMTLGQYMSKNIFEPLEMPTMSFKMTAERRERLAARFTYDNNKHSSKPIERYGNHHVLSSRFESGGAGLIGDVQDYMRFADAMACDGVGWNGYRLLPLTAIKELHTEQLKGESQADFKKLSRVGYGYGLGVRTMVDTNACKSPLGEFGWDSAAGATVLMDGTNHLSFFYAQHILNCGYSYEVIHPTVRDLIYESLEG